MSHSEIPVDVVLKACNGYLENRDRHIRKVKEEHIQSAMRPWRFLGLTFGGRTREEAIRYLEQQQWSEYSMIEIQGGRWAYQVEELRALCQVPGTKTVKLSAEDAHLLRRYFG